MKRLLTALTLILIYTGVSILALPALAHAGSSYGGYMLFVEHDWDKGPILGFKDAEAFLKWQGCDKTWVHIVEVPKFMGPNARYSDLFHGIQLLSTLWNHFDEVTIAYVLAHETGHCLQAQNGKFDYMSVPELEFDAEAHAHKVLTVLGYDADRIMLDARLYMAKLANRDPDSDTGSHGSANSISIWARQHDGLPNRRLSLPASSGACPPHGCLPSPMPIPYCEDIPGKVTLPVCIPRPQPIPPHAGL